MTVLASAAAPSAPDLVPNEELARVLALAQVTPSWCNAQPWEVIVTAGDGARRFRQAMADHLTAGMKGRPDLPFPIG